MRPTEHCPKCRTRTEFIHAHDTPYGLSGAHMAGSERFECATCGYTVRAPDSERFPALVFVLDQVTP